MTVTEHAPGNFCWAELTTSDGAAAKAFYEGLFGWTHLDNPMGPDSVYTMYHKGEGVAAASYQEPGMPPHWGVYITTPDVDAAAAKAKAAGATVLMEPFDVMIHGRMAVLQDPTGAHLSLWQPKEHPGYTVVDEPGAVCWNELNTRDTAAAKSFYASVFGWNPVESPMGGYVEFENNGKKIGGMMAITPEMGDVPPHWLPYFQVENADDSANKAKSLSGRVYHGPADIPGMGRFAIVADPQGAVFGIYGA